MSGYILQPTTRGCCSGTRQTIRNGCHRWVQNRPWLKEFGDLDRSLLIRPCYRSICNSNNTKQPYKWGYKLFVLCDTKVLVHSFDIFTGKIDPAPGKPDIVSHKAQVIHENVKHLLYFDNCLLLLPTRGYQHLGPCSKLACVGAV